MVTIAIVALACFAIPAVALFVLVPSIRHQNEAATEADETRKARATKAGWRVIEDASALPEPVRHNTRGGVRVLMLAHRRTEDVDIWAVARETTAFGGARRQSLSAHLLPVHHIEDTPTMCVTLRRGGSAPAAQKPDLFDRRYEIVSDDSDSDRAHALVTEEIRLMTRRLNLDGWDLEDGMLTVWFDGMLQPASLQRRLLGLARLAKAVSGRPAP